MSGLLGMGALAAGFLLLAGYLSFTAIRRARLARLLLGLGALALAGGCVVGAASLATRAAYRRGWLSLSHLVWRPRTGQQVYTALFGPPTSCLRVIHHTDQVVPRLDCCIWLELATCPAELRRILARAPYVVTTHLATDLARDLPSYSPRPAWWQPARLGPTVLLGRYRPANNPNRDQLLLFAPDSTRAFYCDMAD